jgi:hypothetical protein
VVLPAAGDEPASTHSALLVTRMLRIIAQKAEDLVELQALPEDTLSSSEGIKYFCRPSSAKLRVLMANETSRAADLFFRLNVLAAQKELRQSVIPQLFNLGDVQLPFLLPTKSGLPRPVLVKHDVLLGAIAPQLTVDEQAYAYALEQLATTVYGVEVADFLMGRTASQPATFLQQVVAATSAAVVSRTAQISTVLQPEFLNNLRKRLKETDVGELALALQALDESAPDPSVLGRGGGGQGVADLAPASLSPRGGLSGDLFTEDRSPTPADVANTSNSILPHCTLHITKSAARSYFQRPHLWNTSSRVLPLPIF